jgi:hypothetical protein
LRVSHFQLFPIQITPKFDVFSLTFALRLYLCSDVFRRLLNVLLWELFVWLCAICYDLYRKFASRAVSVEENWH